MAVAAVTLAGTPQVMFTVAKNSVTYTQIETSLINAGITNFRIAREVKDVTTDITIAIFPDKVLGADIPIPVSMLSKLFNAASKFGD